MFEQQLGFGQSGVDLVDQAWGMNGVLVVLVA